MNEYTIEKVLSHLGSMCSAYDAYDIVSELALTPTITTNLTLPDLCAHLITRYELVLSGAKGGWIERETTCDTCDGEKVFTTESGSRQIHCPTCQGTGTVMSEQWEIIND